MNRPLTVALPTSTFLPGLGGVEVGLHNIALRLQKRGHRPVVMAQAPHVNALRRGWSLPYEVIAFPPKAFGLLRRMPTLGFAVLDTWFEWAYRKYRIDVWHCTMGWPTGVALIHYARCRRAVPHLVRCAGEDIQRQPAIGYGARLDPAIDALVRRWLPLADRLVAITPSVLDEYHALGVSDDRIVEIPNGVDLERLSQTGDRTATRRLYGIGDDEFVYLAVGRNHPKKNYSLLLQAAARMKAAGAAGFRVVIAGLGASALRDEAERLGIAAETLLVEQIGSPDSGQQLLLPADPLVRLYQMADVFAFPSLMETFGIVLVEAMAAGLPIITTDAPGCRDIIRQGQDGLMVSPIDPAQLATAMRRVREEAGLWHELTARAKARASAFSWDSVVARYESVYYQLLN
jgi:glycosyltransferase involved in cell wall biosynthesis